VSGDGGVVYAARYRRSVYISHVLGKMFVGRRGGDDLGMESASASLSGTNDAHSSIDLTSMLDNDQEEIGILMR
jgi:hypothetical protein